MDTSITIALIVTVVFVFMLPSYLRKVGRSVERTELDAVPEAALEVDTVTGSRSCMRAEGPELLTAEHAAAEFAPPAPPEPVGTTPRISLSRTAPVLEVIDGDLAAEPAQAPAVHSEEEPVLAIAPMAVGETAPLTLLPDSRPSFPTATDVHMTTSSSPVASAGGSRAPRGRDLPSHMRARTSASRRAPGRPAAPRPGGAGGARGQLRPVSAPEAKRALAPTTTASGRGSVAPTEGRGDSSLATVRAVVPIVSTGLLVFLALGLITGVIALFGAVTWAVPVLSLALAAGSFLVLRSLHRRIRALRLSGPQASSTAEAPRARSGAAPRAAAESGAPRRAGAVRAQQEARNPEAAPSTAPERKESASAASRSVPAVPAQDATPAAATPAATARARVAAGKRPRTTFVARLEADAPAEDTADTDTTGADTSGADTSGADRTRTVAAEPPSSPASTDAKPAAQSAATPSGAVTTTPAPSAEPVTARTRTAGNTEVTGARKSADASADAPSGSGTPAQSTTSTTAEDGESLSPLGLFEQRLEQARKRDAARTPAPERDPKRERTGAKEWTPARVPSPSYVSKPVAARPEPEPVVADATSFSLQPRTRESIAAEFAAELGFRPELTDAARETDSALAHGRTAIGTAQPRAEMTTALGDVLARRRA